MKLFEMIIAAIIVWACVLTVDAFGHEDDNWKHMTDGSGPIIGQRDCGMGIGVWFNDTDRDGEVDRCRAFFLAHETIHYLDYPTTIVKNYRGEYERSCTCETLFAPDNSSEKGI